MEDTIWSATQKKQWAAVVQPDSRLYTSPKMETNEKKEPTYKTFYDGIRQAIISHATKRRSAGCGRNLQYAVNKRMFSQVSGWRRDAVRGSGHIVSHSSVFAIKTLQTQSFSLDSCFLWLLLWLFVVVFSSIFLSCLWSIAGFCVFHRMIRDCIQQLGILTFSHKHFAEPKWPTLCSPFFSSFFHLFQYITHPIEDYLLGKKKYWIVDDVSFGRIDHMFPLNRIWQQIQKRTKSVSLQSMHTYSEIRTIYACSLLFDVVAIQCKFIYFSVLPEIGAPQSEYRLAMGKREVPHLSYTIATLYVLHSLQRTQR